MADNSEKLTDEIKTFVVQQLAGWTEPSVVRKLVKDEYQVEITRQGIQYYDPTTRAGAGLSDEWKTLFIETRKALIDGKVEIGAANKMVRVAWLDAMARKAMGGGNSLLAAQLLEQIAKEMGESFTNRQKIEHAGSLKFEHELSDAELEQRIAARAAELGLTVGSAAGPGTAAGGADAPAGPQQADPAVPG
jgi:hypothetical protein